MEVVFRNENVILELYRNNPILFFGSECKLERSHPEIPQIPALVKDCSPCSHPCCSERCEKRHIMIRIWVGLPCIGSKCTVVDQALAVSFYNSTSEPFIEFYGPVVCRSTRAQ